MYNIELNYMHEYMYYNVIWCLSEATELLSVSGLVYYQISAKTSYWLTSFKIRLDKGTSQTESLASLNSQNNHKIASCL